MGVIDACTDGPGESSEEIGARSRELVTTNKSTVIAKPFLYAIVVEDSSRNRRLPDATRTNESH